MGYELLTIGEVAERFGVRPSTLRYYEEQGLLEPATRRGGRRCYDEAGLRRLALVLTWQQTGLMRLADIRTLVNNPVTTGEWQDVLQARMAQLNQQIDRLQEARRYLDHLMSCPRDDPANKCPYLAKELQTQVDAALSDTTDETELDTESDRPSRRPPLEEFAFPFLANPGRPAAGG
ncbi:MerR family transcriptional regulator [Streptoalloteichus hindustanus]|uniref:DNA-binding transcriptional regulator, MerR family n=1 Tax=Streptoalloteichus hindustanus TaxID=2017 RepID=A0A1M5N954_STRHI|nr:MerR family transcriptional regulator [Streptoalloteichus hindustanus]SHG86126.1 DNA-binding transcriptional regulator, MerR family [Streptoalloteichus hindustanus]